MTFAILCVTGSYAQQDAARLDALLRELGRADQMTRILLHNAVKNGKIDSIAVYAQDVIKVDEVNQRHVDKILRQGIPDKISDEAYKAIFLIVDHADTKYQKQHFKHIRHLSTNGHIALCDVATLKDRILMNSGRKQLYGTQTKAKHIVLTSEGVKPQLINYVWPVRNPGSLDARRSDVGLGSISQQAEAHKAVGYEMIFDHRLSKKEIILLTSSHNK